MVHMQSVSFNPLSKPLRLFVALLSAVLVAASSARGQSADSLSSVKKVYRQSFGQDETASKLRERSRCGHQWD